MPVAMKVVLLSCGSFNPPTNMHMRMFEIARDYLHKTGNYIVIGGFISPVHDAYKKKDLVPVTHRIAMLKLALQSSEWVRLSEWESKQENWSRTKVSLNYHQNLINSVINATNNQDDVDSDVLDCLYRNLKNGIRENVQVKLLCGADLLESFSIPGLWADEDIETIVGQYGLVVVTRLGTDPWKFVYESDILTKYKNNIQIVTEWITNEISSTKVRRALRRQESVKYLLDDKIIDYIYRNNLYGCEDTQNSKNKIEAQDKMSPRHPGQAIKILTDSTGRTLITSKEVCSETSTLDGSYSKSPSAISLVEHLYVKRKANAKSNTEIFV